MTTRTNNTAIGEQRAIAYLSRAQSRLRDASDEGDDAASNALAHVSQTLQVHQNLHRAPKRNGKPQ